MGSKPTEKCNGLMRFAGTCGFLFRMSWDVMGFHGILPLPKCSIWNMNPYIYPKNGSNVGKYACTMEHLGNGDLMPIYDLSDLSNTHAVFQAGM
jgi:hypothetical protein